MKKVYKILVIIFIATLTSCSDNDTLQNEALDGSSILKEGILERKIDSKYNIPNHIYNEFIDSLIFDEKGNVIGAIYDEIENQLDDDSSNKFWGNFGFTVRTDTHISRTSSTISGVSVKNSNSEFETNPAIFEGYKPKRGGCKANNRWICVIREY